MQCIFRTIRTKQYVVSSSVFIEKIEPATGQVLGSSGPLFAWFEEADQNPQILCRDDLREAQNGLFWSYTVGKCPYKGIIENQETRKVGLSETHASGNREAFTDNDCWKANWWNKYQQERSRRTWNDDVREFFWRGSVHTLTEPRRRIE